MQCFVVWVGDTAGAARLAQIVGTMEPGSEERAEYIPFLSLLLFFLGLRFLLLFLGLSLLFLSRNQGQGGYDPGGNLSGKI